MKFMLLLTHKRVRQINGIGDEGRFLLRWMEMINPIGMKQLSDRKKKHCAATSTYTDYINDSQQGNITLSDLIIFSPCGYFS